MRGTRNAQVRDARPLLELADGSVLIHHLEGVIGDRHYDVIVFMAVVAGCTTFLETPSGDADLRVISVDVCMGGQSRLPFVSC